MDFVLQALRGLVQKAGSYGVGLEALVEGLVASVQNGRGLVLLHQDRAGAFDGLAYGVFVADREQPYVEIIALYAPWRARAIRDEGWQWITAWARARGAQRILMSVTRAPQAFYRRYYAALGFRPCAVVMEAHLAD